jgi:hypothetical protein
MHLEQGRKLATIRAALAEHGLAALRLRGIDWFAWATCGGSNAVAMAAETGVAELVVTADGAYVLTDAIEAQRLEAEEVSQAWTVLAHPWDDPSPREWIVREQSGGGLVASDRPAPGERPLPASLRTARWSLLPEEQERLRVLGSDTAEVVTDAFLQAEPTWMGTRLAAAVSEGLVHRGIAPGLLLVGDSGRLWRWRHPTVSNSVLGRRVMVVICSRRAGLYACCSRLVAFGEPVLEDRHVDSAVLEVESAALDASRPGTTLGEVLARIREAYVRVGKPEAWREHHQGGLTGYLARERIATPGDATPIPPESAVAWNPSLPGSKSEDTVLVHADGTQEVVTVDARWPAVTVGGRRRPEVLSR